MPNSLQMRVHHAAKAGVTLQSYACGVLALHHGAVLHINQPFEKVKQRSKTCAAVQLATTHC